MSETLDLALLGTGSVVAPAGHGKTYSIGKTAHDHPELRILALTHTNAGVAALKRHSRSGIRSFRVETIASFSLRIARAFPARAGWDEEAFDLKLIHPAALQALTSPTVLAVVAAGFDLIIVDEYQDCSQIQAAIIDSLATLIPTVVVGDPLQAIYDFGADGALAWNGETSILPKQGELTVPHRWKTSNPALGEWLQYARFCLEKGYKPDISTNNPPLTKVWSPADGIQRGLHRFLTADTTTAIISPDSRNTNALSMVARAYRGRVRVAETTDFRDVRESARKIDEAKSRADVLSILIDFVAVTQTKTKTSVVNTLQKNLKSKGAASHSLNPTVTAAKQYLSDGRTSSALAFIRKLIEGGADKFRPETQSLLLRSLAVQDSDPNRTLEECAQELIEGLHHRSSWVPSGNIVGTTLRLKGLEFDKVVIVDPASIPNNKHLYVALTRPSRELVLVFPES